MVETGKKYLITTDMWFRGPDGQHYKSAWGTVKVLNDEETLGIKTNARSANWYVKVGSEENHVIVAGCQIHYAIRCEEKPVTTKVNDWELFDGQVREYSRPSGIYIAE